MTAIPGKVESAAQSNKSDSLFTTKENSTFVNPAYQHSNELLQEENTVLAISQAKQNPSRTLHYTMAEKDLSEQRSLSFIIKF